jgi:hypothetical protein
MISRLNLAVAKRVALATSLGLLVLVGSLCFGQQLTGTLSGTTFDQSGAVVPNAAVSMKNSASGDIRTTVSNGSGNFSITAVQPGTYSVTVSAPGFKSWREDGIVFAQGDNKTLPNISLLVGQAEQVVEVTTGAAIVALDTAEVSTVLNTELIQDVPIVGRDAGELLKLLPGSASTNGINQGNSFSDKVVSTNLGPVGSYSINGTQPNGAMAFMLDGANLVDPGNAGTQIANINQDMVSEVKVLTSSYSAEYAKGPVIFQAFSKSGGNQFHGEGYLYARNSALNSWDAYAASQNTQFRKDPTHTAAQDAAYAKTLHGDESYYYMGGNVGGPIPFLNKGRQKVFFWGGYEYMRQHPAGSAINYNVPTLAQKGTDSSNPAGLAVFDEAAVPSGVFGPWGYAYQHPQYNLPAGSQTYLANGTPATPGTTCDGTVGGVKLPNCTKTTIPTSAFDPNILGVLKLYPNPNATPNAGNGWNNYTIALNLPQNRWEATGKVDYSISDNTKLSVSYTRQIENDQHPIAVWWAPAWTLPYPSPVVAKTTSQEVMTNLTHVFSPTTTNEFVFTLARYINPSQLGKPSAVDRGNLGFNVTGLFGHTTKQIPSFLAPWGGSFPDIRQFSFDGSFNGGSFGGLKRDPAIYDNFTKVIGSHTIKLGAYWDTSENIQSSSANDNGVFNGGWAAGIGTNNVVSDFVLGRVNNYQQSSAIPVDDIKFHQWSVYAQDSFKANRQLTVNYGLRFDHVGQWYGVPKGIQVWDPASYVNGTPLSPNSINNTGLLYHAINSHIPLSGFKSPLFYYEPRVGLAYDLFGTGKTVFRTGFAVFRYQVSTQVCGNNACDGPAGTVNYQTPSSFTGYANASTFTPPSASFENGSTIGALQEGDNRTPLTMDWNVSISQALPWRSVFEASYVANKSQNEWINGGNGKLYDLNNVIPGNFFLPDPVLSAQQGKPVFVSPAAPSGSGYPSFTAQHFKPLTNYQEVYLLSHGSYANYNSLQVSWQKQSGPVNYLINYTFSKVLGIRDGQTDNGAGNGTVVDPFSLKNNYGTLAYDHTHILNLSYVWNLPKPIHGNPLLSGAVNGWQVSGYTTYQSGAPLQPNLNGNLNAQWPGGLPPGSQITLPNGLLANAVNPSTWFGTNAINNLLPVVVCDPRNHRGGQYFNPNCFAAPAYGQQGSLVWPYVRGPGYFDSDLGIFKNFQITERQKVQFRLSALNFLNHPLPQFGLAGNGDQQLSFVGNNGTLSQFNTNATTTGKPAFKTGSRTLTFALKYYF